MTEAFELTDHETGFKLVQQSDGPSIIKVPAGIWTTEEVSAVMERFAPFLTETKSLYFQGPPVHAVSEIRLKSQ